MASAGERFKIDTKVVSFTPGSHTNARIHGSINTSLKLLKTSAVNVEYLHVPDRDTPFAETLEAMDQAHQSGKFEAFGLSNYTAAEVEEIVKICDEKRFVKPTVYQGQYNAIVRSGEQELFPVLRKHGIAFYAWRSGHSHSVYMEPVSDNFEQSGRRGSIRREPQKCQGW